MRYRATQIGKYDVKRVMLVENPQDERYRGCIVSYVSVDKEDGPPDGGQVYEGYAIEQIFKEFEEDYDIKRTDWQAIPDQIPGCEDEWVAPVRHARDYQGNIIQGSWEQLVNNQWVSFTL